VERSGRVLIKALPPHLPSQTVKKLRKPEGSPCLGQHSKPASPEKKQEGGIVGSKMLHFMSSSAALIYTKSQTKYENGDRSTRCKPCPALSSTNPTLTIQSTPCPTLSNTNPTLRVQIIPCPTMFSTNPTLTVRSKPSPTVQHKSYTDRSEQTLPYTVQHKSYTDRSGTVPRPPQ
jgi:hypothetical protein